MAGILSQLHSSEALLLMYLADELPDAERRQVEQMLAGDPALREQLEALKGLQEGLFGAIEQSDAALPWVAPEAVVRRTLRAMRQHQLTLASRAIPEAAPRNAWRIPRWAQPLIGVAAAIILVIGLWGFGFISLPVDPQTAGSLNHLSEDADPVESIVATVDPLELEASFAGDSGSGLDEARFHAVELEAISEEAALPILF